MHPEHGSNFINIIDKKIIIFKYGQHTNVGDDAHRQKQFSFSPLRLVDPDAGEIIDDDREYKDQYIDRDKEHVKHTARYEQVKPSPAMRDQEVQNGNDRKEKQESEGVEYHVVLISVSLVGRYRFFQAAQI